MKTLRAALVAALALPLGLATAAEVAAQPTSLRIFVGGQQRPDVMRQLLDQYQATNPSVKVDLETGGATSELQRQYLTTVLTSKDASLDVFLIDIVNPAQYAASGWLEPLDSHLGTERDALLKRYLPAYATADVVDGKVVALPAFADAMFLYYRKDLLEKHRIKPPATWEELSASARKILDAENNPNLQGVSFQGRAIEGANCTFLVPYWGAGAELTTAGKVQVDQAAARKAFGLWLDMMKAGVAPKNAAEVATDDTRREFQAGNVAFAVLWAYGWNLFQSADSKVAGKVGVVPLPAFAGGRPVTCIGGWQWALSAFSRHKVEAAKLIRWLSSPATAKFLAVHASNLPVYPEVYKDAEVLGANAWFEQALPVVMTARSRPVSPRYPEVSDVIRSNVNAVIAGTKTPDEAIRDMQARLARVFR
jgi:trehalose/maltose transport system substrate-binding protein